MLEQVNQDLKVALISPEYPPFSIGGVSAVCRDLSINLAKKAVRTTVFCGKSDKLTVENVNDYLTIVRLPLLNLPPRHLWFQTQNLSTLVKLLKDFDIIHSVDTRATAFLSYFKNELRQPFVTHVHGCGHCETNVFVKSPLSYWSFGEFVYTVLEYPLNEYLTNLRLKNSDHIVVCSTARLEEMKRRNSNLDFSKISVIDNGINFDKISLNPNIEEKEDSVLFWGRLFYNKGIVQLIKAMALVKKNFPNVTLDVCGKGPLEPKLRSLVQRLNLQNNVFIHGYVSTPYLVNKIHTASVVALPSIYEGQPVAVLEAMAYKKPIVMYDYPFAREYVVDWKNGLIAKGGDVKDLADRICAALSDKKLRLKLANEASVYVRKEHNWDILVQKYIYLYHGLLKK